MSVWSKGQPDQNSSTIQMTDAQSFVGKVVADVGEDMFAMNDVVELCLMAFFCGRHVLLDGNPGLGKTALVKALSGALHIVYNRIQFTPDLMPTDITGTHMPVPGEDKWEFQPGNIFAHIVLADEINRATPKTQSAMLQAMEERKITVPGATYSLPIFDKSDARTLRDGEKLTEEERNSRAARERQPFMILATQNPIDHEGVFSLPEAQIDRFMFKLSMRMPLGPDLKEIMDKETGPTDGIRRLRRGFPANPGLADMTLEQRALHELTMKNYGEFNDRIRKVDIDPMVTQHILNLVAASNKNLGEVKELTNSDKSALTETGKRLRFGLGTRAAINLMLGSRANRVLFGKGAQSSVGATDLAVVLAPVLNHRLHLTFEYDNLESRREVLSQLIEYSAPTSGTYRKNLMDALRELKGKVSAID